MRSWAGHRAGGDLATALASRYGCPALEATAGLDGVGGSDESTAGHTAGTRTDAHATDPHRKEARAATRRRLRPPPKPAHWCRRPPTSDPACADRSYSAQYTKMPPFDGSKNIDDVINAVEPRCSTCSHLDQIASDLARAGPKSGGRLHQCAGFGGGRRRRRGSAWGVSVWIGGVGVGGVVGVAGGLVGAPDTGRPAWPPGRGSRSATPVRWPGRRPA